MLAQVTIFVWVNQWLGPTRLAKQDKNDLPSLSPFYSLRHILHYFSNKYFDYAWLLPLARLEPNELVTIIFWRYCHKFTKLIETQDTKACLPEIGNVWAMPLFFTLLKCYDSVWFYLSSGDYINLKNYFLLYFKPNSSKPQKIHSFIYKKWCWEGIHFWKKKKK